MDPSRYSRTMLVGGHSPFVQSKNSICSLCEGALAMTPRSQLRDSRKARLLSRRGGGIDTWSVGRLNAGISCQAYVRCDSKYLSSDPRAVRFVCGHFFFLGCHCKSLIFFIFFCMTPKRCSAVCHYLQINCNQNGVLFILRNTVFSLDRPTVCFIITTYMLFINSIRTITVNL